MTLRWTGQTARELPPSTRMFWHRRVNDLLCPVLGLAHVLLHLGKRLGVAAGKIGFELSHGACLWPCPTLAVHCPDAVWTIAPTAGPPGPQIRRDQALLPRWPPWRPSRRPAPTEA